MDAGCARQRIAMPAADRHARPWIIMIDVPVVC